MAKTPETTIATLDMQGSGTLTLTNRHLRGQVLRMVQQGNMQVKQMEQIDVLLSNVAGYSIVDVPLKFARIIAVAVCALVGVGGWGLYAILGKLMDMSVVIPIVVTLLAACMAVVCLKTIKDAIGFELNIMGGKFMVPLKAPQKQAVQDFIVKLRDAKTVYEEENG